VIVSQTRRWRKTHSNSRSHEGTAIGRDWADLGQPMAATDYMTEAGIRALVRDPKSVRTRPQQQMPAFAPTVLPDTDLNVLIAYRKQIANQRSR